LTAVIVIQMQNVLSVLLTGYISNDTNTVVFYPVCTFQLMSIITDSNINRPFKTS